MRWPTLCRPSSFDARPNEEGSRKHSDNASGPASRPGSRQEARNLRAHGRAQMHNIGSLEEPEQTQQCESSAADCCRQALRVHSVVVEPDHCKHRTGITRSITFRSLSGWRETMLNNRHHLPVLGPALAARSTRTSTIAGPAHTRGGRHHRWGWHGGRAVRVPRRGRRRAS
jgi:hypothetical protein